MVDNFKPGAWSASGSARTASASRNPGLVHCSITGFGAGPGAALPGYDPLVQALSGLMSITGPADGEPSKVGVALVDVIAGLSAAVAILAALRERDRSGEGQRIEVDLLSQRARGARQPGERLPQRRGVPARLGNVHPSIEPFATYAAADGPLMICAGNDHQFAALARALGCARAGGRRRVSRPTRPGSSNRDALRALIEERLAGAPVEEWVERLRAAGRPGRSGQRPRRRLRARRSSSASSRSTSTERRADRRLAARARAHAGRHPPPAAARSTSTVTRSGAGCVRRSPKGRSRPAAVEAAACEAESDGRSRTRPPSRPVDERSRGELPSVRCGAGLAPADGFAGPVTPLLAKGGQFEPVARPALDGIEGVIARYAYGRFTYNVVFARIPESQPFVPRLQLRAQRADHRRHPLRVRGPQLAPVDRERGAQRALQGDGEPVPGRQLAAPAVRPDLHRLARRVARPATSRSSSPTARCSARSRPTIPASRGSTALWDGAARRSPSGSATSRTSRRRCRSTAPAICLLRLLRPRRADLHRARVLIGRFPLPDLPRRDLGRWSRSGWSSTRSSRRARAATSSGCGRPA